MRPARYNMRIVKGDTWKKEFTFPMILAGYAIRLQAKKSASSDLIVIDLAIGSGFTVVGAVATLLVSDETTAEYNFDALLYSMKLEAAGVEETWVAGNLTLSDRGVTA